MPITERGRSTSSLLDERGRFVNGTLTEKGELVIGATSITPVISPPVVTIISVDRNKISGQVGIDRSIVIFKFDIDVNDWTVNVMGVDYATGIIADSGNFVPAGTEITAVIDWTELYQEGSNRVNIYGKNIEGTWNQYEG